ncbi:efflux RND transporter periplasmic adaptor subunit [Rubinisphaera margarita]|uniref:efflux RND transporter periplasmic adaptor subunit n=1 Tax=Rubinisphaera margarita TaxID=2909586 RepID=UPI001EE9399C|nr:HlyD family efflux transporter periplasmic adaptor subunit [Rubinisphaera margarita]MCG6158243.1 HlyD family efflux transporter periplasmic adaptor subunit [Rubinisphaera margarita]
MTSATRPQLDLRELAIDRPSKATTEPKVRRKPLLTRYLIPGGIVLGFLGLLAAAVSDQLLPRHEVSVVPVLVRRAEIQQQGTPLFQAAGWVEPRPTPISVAALTEGVVEELLVVEGQPVEIDEPVARLINIDARLALRQAQNTLQLRKAELESAKAEVDAAELRVEFPVHLQATLADAESSLAQARTNLARLPHLIKAAEARAVYAEQNYEGKQAAEGAIAGRLIQQALSEFTDAEAQLTELRERKPYLEKEVSTLEEKVTAFNSQLELLIEESRQLKDAHAKRQVAESRVAEAELAVEMAQLNVDRTIVRAPIAGRVLTLVTSPGSRVMGLESSGALSSSTVVTMYDPARLQVRADVRLEDVPLVQPGQPVEIETASSSEPIKGRVLLPTSTANIQKNTLEVKVEVEDPPATIRPEMLVTATFLAPPTPESQLDEVQEAERLLIPRDLVTTAEQGTSVWIVTAEGTAVLQPVTLGKAGTEELVEVASGLDPTSKVIATGRQGLEAGTAVEIIGEASSGN